MLIHTLRAGASISIGQGIFVSVVHLPGKCVRLVVDAPPGQSIERHDGTIVSERQLREILTINPPLE